MATATGLANEQLRTLGELRKLPDAAGLHLAGGSAIAFHLQHRRSLDLDLFGANVDLDRLRASLAATDREVEVVSVSDATLRLRWAGAAVDIVRYPYAPLEPPAPGPAGFPTAGLLDLATMKLAALSRRGLRRDFWDLHEIVRSGVALPDAARAYCRRFGRAEADLYHVMRSLTYFDDAEREPALPQGLSIEHWDDIKAFFRARAPDLLRVSGPSSAG